ncbi:hypothetical protein Ahu01nite_096720 [Winogradskya humida]|uniref:Ig-like domain-containing protein n=1 Tax=Winogradskya humida TaxID=113566 RepID=A0ABQ4A6U0_9ACTN|nr:hypothetical protein Ahu01nite_096720 [Actinoplanes humidus]
MWGRSSSAEGTNAARYASTASITVLGLRWYPATNRSPRSPATVALDPPEAPRIHTCTAAPSPGYAWTATPPGDTYVPASNARMSLTCDS